MITRRFRITPPDRLQGKLNFKWLTLLAPIVLAIMLAGCLTPSEENPSDDLNKPPLDPVQGESDFVSADGVAGQQAPDNRDGSDDVGSEAPADDEYNGGESGDDRTVQEGDIYRVLGNGLILNLNSYRGLQVIDFNDVSKPRIIGRAEMSGYPVEMYVVEDQAYVLMNDWRGYYGSRFDTKFEEVSGGIVIQVDLGDPTNPVVIDQAYVTGSILRSRVVSGSRAAALYVAASAYGQFEDPATGNSIWGTRSYVKSFDIFNASLVDKTEMEIGGYVTDIQATPQALLVARWNDSWWTGDSAQAGSLISIIDISSPDGTMVAGDEIIVKGIVSSQFNMDLYKGVLRIASGTSWWGENNTNWVQTYDATDFSNLVLIDEKPFGNPQEQLYATLFLENKAFFVTFFRQDPFHAFEITDEGMLTEKSEFIVSGWNDFFRAVMDKTRLIGIGMDNGGTEGGNRAAVSLYDITDLENPEPLIDRAQVNAQWTWSEANWDHRAFSVLENAVSVENQDGILETGLVLLPFSGYDSNWSRYQSSVQIFTFSHDSLTMRGVMSHPSTVRRTFLADDGLATNLSETDMAFYDMADPDSPVELGSVELAPNYSAIIPLGEYAARLKQPGENYYWYSYTAEELAKASSMVEIVRFDGNPDLAEPIATVEVPSWSSLVKSGNLLVATSVVWEPDNGDGKGQYQVRLVVIDVADPRNPKVRSDVVRNDLPVNPWGRGWYGGMDYDCWNCYYYWGSTTLTPEVVGDKLVFQEYVSQKKREGTRTYCWEYPTHSSYDCENGVNEGSDEYYGGSGSATDAGSAPNPSSDGGAENRNDGSDFDAGAPFEERDDQQDAGHSNNGEVCTYYAGGRNCMSVDDGPETCWGAFYKCTSDSYGRDNECWELEADAQVDTYKNCDTEPYYRYWTQYVFHVVDLANPVAPKVLEQVEMPAADEGVGILIRDSKLYHSYKRPVSVSDDARPFVRYYYRQIDLAGGSYGPEINVPGRLIEMEGDTVFTEDFVYGEEVVESAINKLTVKNGKAFLDGRKRFEDQVVSGVLVDGQGHVYVNHMPSYYYGGYYYNDDVAAPAEVDAVDSEDGVSSSDESATNEADRYISKLSIFAIEDEEFTQLSSKPVDRFASLMHAMPGRAIFQVNTGIVVMNTDDPAKPFPQAYFPTKGWPQGFVAQDNHIMFAAGRYGIYWFDADTYNLLAR